MVFDCIFSFKFFFLNWLKGFNQKCSFTGLCRVFWFLLVLLKGFLHCFFTVFCLFFLLFFMVLRSSGDFLWLGAY